MVKMQKNAKRFCAVLLALGVLLSMSTVISARYAAIRSLTAGLTISSSGYASCQGTCTVQSEYDAKVVLELNRRRGLPGRPSWIGVTAEEEFLLIKGSSFPAAMTTG